MISRFCGSVIALMVTGCALPEPPIRATAIQYNHIVADTHNELLLLNILRAGDGYPMYFTALSDLRGSMTVDVSGGISQSVNGRDLTVEDSLDKDRLFSGLSRTVSRGVDTITPSLSAKLSASPSFNYAVLDTQDFYNGILTSIPESTIIHLLDQGWRSELLAPLVIESAVGNGVEADRERFLECYSMFRVGLTTADTKIGPLEELIKAQAIDFSAFDPGKLKIDNKEVFLAGGTRPKLVMAPKEECAVSDVFPELVAAANMSISELTIVYNIGQTFNGVGEEPAEPYRKQVEAQLQGYMSMRSNGGDESEGQENEKSSEPCSTKKDAESELSLVIRVKLRSTQGMIYAIGEQVRSVVRPSEKSIDEGIRFKLVCGAGIKYAVSTLYNGTRCGIEDGDGEDRKDSLKTLALLNQLINLQKSSKDKPSTQQVTVVE